MPRLPRLTARQVMLKSILRDADLSIEDLEKLL
jgi:hypothetical protein